MNPAEPTAAALANPWLRYFLATRPPFLSVTLMACFVGLATAHAAGHATAVPAAVATVVFALLAHAGVNVLNDYYDDLNGTDRLNDERIFPFTGGSRFIQNGVLTPAETFRFGALLLSVVVPAGLWLTLRSGPGLIAIGILGLFIGWAYSAPPLRLNGRGCGEVCVALGFGLIVAGTDYVQRAALTPLTLAAALPYALMVTNILYINQFPDRRADEQAGKRHWVVIIGPRRARWGYLLIAGIAHAWIPAAVALDALPAPCLLALGSAPLAIRASGELFRHAEQPSLLATAIKLTIAAAIAHGALLATGLLL